MSKPKIAIVTDWLTSAGGAERIIVLMHQLYPDADIYTSAYRPEIFPELQGAKIHSFSFLKFLPKGTSKHQWYTIPRAIAFSLKKLKGYDVVISFGASEAKYIRVAKGTKHIDYCNSPTHYYWVRPDEYLANPGLGFLSPIFTFGLRILLPVLRKFDYKKAQKSDIMIANSTNIQKRISKFYHRKSIVIHPPVDTSRIMQSKPNQINRDYYIVVGRQVMYKRIDLAVQACAQLDLPLKVYGNGPMHQQLIELAGDKTQFITNANDQEVAKALWRAKGFIFTSLDDFGIAPVEAMAAGCPVIAYGDGGALDTVSENQSGIFFAKQQVDSLVEALKKFETLKFDQKIVQKQAQKFSNQVFAKKITDVIDKYCRN